MKFKNNNNLIVFECENRLVCKEKEIIQIKNNTKKFKKLLSQDYDNKNKPFLGEKDFVYSSNLNDNFIYKRKTENFYISFNDPSHIQIDKKKRVITIYQKSHLDKFLITGKEISNWKINFKSYVTSNTIYPNTNNLTGCLTFMK